MVYRIIGAFCLLIGTLGLALQVRFTQEPLMVVVWLAIVAVGIPLLHGTKNRLLGLSPLLESRMQLVGMLLLEVSSILFLATLFSPLIFDSIRYPDPGTLLSLLVSGGLGVFYLYSKSLGQGVLVTVLLSIVIIMLMPMVWLIAACLKTTEDLFSYTFFAPRFSLESFGALWDATNVPFYRYMVNSFFISCASVLIQLFFSSLGGFALAKYQFFGKKAIMIVMLGTMMIPAQVLMAPLYELIYKMGLVDTYLGLIIPGAVSVFGMFLFRQSILQVPNELLEAGRVDGCSEFRLFWNIVFPVSRPMVGAFCLIAFMGHWNSFLWPQIMLHTEARYTLPIGLNNLVGLYSQAYGAMMAGTFLSVLPVALLFFVLQDEFISGLTAGAVKG